MAISHLPGIGSVFTERPYPRELLIDSGKGLGPVFPDHPPALPLPRPIVEIGKDGVVDTARDIGDNLSLQWHAQRLHATLQGRVPSGIAGVPFAQPGPAVHVVLPAGGSAQTLRQVTRSTNFYPEVHLSLYAINPIPGGDAQRPEQGYQ